jgi:formyl-CoA transferase
VPSGLFPCKGGGPNDYVYVIANGALQPKVKVWDSLLRVIEREDLIGDERYATLPDREQRKDEVLALMSNWTSQHPKRAVMVRLAEAGILCSAVFDVEDHLNDPHLVSRGAIEEYEHPTRGTVRVPACPVRLSASAATTRRPPLIGEHTDEILADLLGYDEDRLAQLRADGVV